MSNKKYFFLREKAFSAAYKLILDCVAPFVALIAIPLILLFSSLVEGVVFNILERQTRRQMEDLIAIKHVSKT